MVLLVFCNVTTYGESCGEVGDDDADDDDGDGDERVPGPVGGGGEVDLELVADNPDGDNGEQGGYEAAEGAVGNAAQDEGTLDEAGVGAHHAHGADGLALGVEGDADEGVDEDDGDEHQDEHEGDEEPREFVEALAELVDDVFLVDDAGDALFSSHLLAEAVENLVAVVGQERDVEVDHQRGVEGVVANEADEVLAEFVGEDFGGLLLGYIVDMLDVVALLDAAFDGEGERVGDIGREVDLVGDALLSVMGDTVGVVLDAEQEPEHEEREGDAKDGGTVVGPEGCFLLQFSIINFQLSICQHYGHYEHEDVVLLVFGLVAVGEDDTGARGVGHLHDNLLGVEVADHLGEELGVEADVHGVALVLAGDGLLGVV